MNAKLFCAIILFTSLDSFSQTEKTTKGKVKFEEFALQNVEIINSNSKKVTLSDAEGNFSIDVKLNDIIVFVAKNYELKKLYITPLTFGKEDIIISLNLKPEELAEVSIFNTTTIKADVMKQWKYQNFGQYNLDKLPSSIKAVDYSDSPIPNGVDFIQIGSMVANLFSNGKEKQKEKIPQNNFKALVEVLVNHQYYLKTLNLEEDEINLFLQYCEADPRSQQVIKDKNILAIMDFLTLKNLDFKKF